MLCVCLCDWNQCCLTWTCSNWVLEEICWADVYVTGSSPDNATGAHLYPWYTVTPARWVLLEHTHTLCHLPGECNRGTLIPPVHCNTCQYWGTSIYCNTCQVSATGAHSYPQYTATPARCVILGHAYTRWHLPGECYWSTLTRARPYPWYTATCQVSAIGAHLLGHAHTHDTLPPARCVLLGHIHLNIHCPTC